MLELFTFNNSNTEVSGELLIICNKEDIFLLSIRMY